MKTQKFIFMAVIAALLSLAQNLHALAIGDELPEQGVYWKVAEGMLNLRVEDKNFYLYLVDKDNKILKIDAEIAIVRYEGVKKKNQDDTIKLEVSEDGLYLTSPRFVKPPHDYWVRVTLDPTDETKKKVLQRVRLNQ